MSKIFGVTIGMLASVMGSVHLGHVDVATDANAEVTVDYQLAVPSQHQAKEFLEAREHHKVVSV